jgi:hypothetical protein
MRECLFIENRTEVGGAGQTGANDPRRTLRLTLAWCALVRTIERDRLTTPKVQRLVFSKLT